MKTLFLIGYLFCIMNQLAAQSLEQRLASAWERFAEDPQLASASASVCIVEATTGKQVFGRNEGMGLAPASTQKIVTTVTAYELLGPQFRFRTDLGYRGTLTDGILTGDLLITGHGDPTLGSTRYQATRPENFFRGLRTAIRAAGIRKITGRVIACEQAWESQAIPGGWIWDDIGNYYGAGASALNYRENQYELTLRSGRQAGEPVLITGTEPPLAGIDFTSEVTGGGSGDNSYIYLPPGATRGVIRGTIPVGQSAFRIAGSLPDPALQLARETAVYLFREGLSTDTAYAAFYSNKLTISEVTPTNELWTVRSPSLDSVIYWFNRKSVNLYGESLLKAIAALDGAKGSTNGGVSAIQQFWNANGIRTDELHLEDGSGLSPQNRLTTRAQVAILRYAATRSWFPGFFDALPTYNGMKMKSGTISRVKGFCGYHSSHGRTYAFSLLVNNYNGSPAALVNKMYQVLDQLK